MKDLIRRSNIETANDMNLAHYNDSSGHGKSVAVKKNSKPRKYCRTRQMILHGPLAGIAALMLLSAFLTATVSAGEFMRTADWETSYEAAIQEAKENKRNLLIYFRAEEDSPKWRNATEEKFVSSESRTGDGTIRQVTYVSPSQQRPLPLAETCRKFEREILTDPEVLDGLDNHVLLYLPTDFEMRNEDGEMVRLLESTTFQEMERYPGLAMMDFEHDDQEYYGKLVGILPFLRAQTPDVQKTRIFLDLPPGTLTQRTLIYAIRIHPERPQSTAGTPEPAIMQAAKEHSEYQAKTGVLGHQNFGTRSAKISAAMGGGGASEICAQSWSGEGLYEAAIGCVRAWRNSSGHWSSAKRKHRYYGYDIVRGRNNTWYATGLFVD